MLSSIYASLLIGVRPTWRTAAAFFLSGVRNAWKDGPYLEPFSRGNRIEILFFGAGEDPLNPKTIQIQGQRKRKKTAPIGAFVRPDPFTRRPDPAPCGA